MNSILPLVSVIIPTYNSAEFLPATLDSIFAQSYNNLEIIVVDDGSTDKTLDVIRPYFSKIIYNRIEHLGLPGIIRNRGFRLAKGDLIVFCDSDDVMSHTLIAEQASILTKYSDVGMVSSDFYIFSQDGTITKSYFSHQNIFSRLESVDITKLDNERYILNDHIHEHLLWCNFIATGATMLRKTELVKVGLFDEKLFSGQDFDLWIRMARNFKIALINKILFGYRRHSHSVTGSERAFKSAIEFWKGTLSYVKNRDLRAHIRENISWRHNTLGYMQEYKANYRAGFNHFLAAVRYNPMALQTYLVLVKSATKNVLAVTGCWPR